MDHKFAINVDDAEISKFRSKPENKQDQQLIIFIQNKCNSFYDERKLLNSNSLLEELLKMQMLEQASNKCPDLSSNQIMRIVERDWRYLTSEERQKLLCVLSQNSEDPTSEINQQELLVDRQFQTLKQRLQFESQ